MAQRRRAALFNTSPPLPVNRGDWLMTGQGHIEGKWHLIDTLSEGAVLIPSTYYFVV